MLKSGSRQAAVSNYVITLFTSLCVTFTVRRYSSTVYARLSVRPSASGTSLKVMGSNTYTVKVVTSRKRCKLATLLLQATDKKWCKAVLLPAALRAAQTCRCLIYSETDFEVFRPAGAIRCTDGGEIWHGGGDLPPWSPPPCQISPPSVQRQGCRTQKIEIFTQIWPKSRI